MKFMKYTFRTPLHGSIECSDVLPNEDPIELSSSQMCRLYSEHEELNDFLRKNQEDLADCVYEGLEDVVLRAEFGDVAMLNGELYLMTHIWTESELTDAKKEDVMDWILDQMSDGWGEHLEQRAWMSERVETSHIYFDEESLTFETDYDSWFVYYYIHAWVSDKDYQVVLQECEEVEFAEAEEVAHISVPNYERHVYKVANELALKELIRNVKRSELTTMIETVCYEPGCTYYLVFEGADKDKLLPKWACDYNLKNWCSVYYNEPVSGLSCTCSGIAVEEAIMHILA